MHTAFSKVLTASIVRAMINGLRKVSTHLAYSTAPYGSGSLPSKYSKYTRLSYFHELRLHLHFILYVLCKANVVTCAPTYIRYWYLFLLIYHTEFSKNLNLDIPTNEEVKSFKYYTVSRL